MLITRFAALAVTVAVTAALTAVAPAALGSAGAAAAPTSTVKARGSAFSSIANPKRNSTPVPDYNNPCWNKGVAGAANTATCHTQELAAINHQHALEHVRSIVLPRGYWRMSRARQTFVIINLERTSRRLKPVLGINAQMSTWAAKAVRKSSDPGVGAWDLSNGSHLQTFGAVWASDLNVLDADFIWMYADGWGAAGSQNVDCTSGRSSGCWGHRQIVLGRFGGSAALVAGVAGLAHHEAHGLLNSDAEAIANYTGRKPALTYTWARAVAAGAR